MHTPAQRLEEIAKAVAAFSACVPDYSTGIDNPFRTTNPDLLGEVYVHNTDTFERLAEAAATQGESGIVSKRPNDSPFWKNCFIYRDVMFCHHTKQPLSLMRPAADT